jgi:hypothetical protein
MGEIDLVEEQRICKKKKGIEEKNIIDLNTHKHI